MKADFLYTNALGRLLMKALHHTGAFKAAAFVMHTPLSRCMIAPFIRSNHIDMQAFSGQRYRSFAEFFARTKPCPAVACAENELISPCDGLLSAFTICENLELRMKESCYRLTDLIPDAQTAALFAQGLCLVFRLQASDYHHFCSIDDLKQGEIHFIPGLLHSVQPIACRSVPVYRLNRRWWRVLETRHFGLAAQIEVGAMVVGGVTHRGAGQTLKKGEEMGNFELAGSTIVLLFSQAVREKLAFYPPFGGENEAQVRMGEAVGRLNA